MGCDTERMTPLFAGHRALTSKISNFITEITGRNVHQQGYLGFMKLQCEQNATELHGSNLELGKAEGDTGTEKKLGEKIALEICLPSETSRNTLIFEDSFSKLWLQ